ncbi:MAG: hypothetical protein KA436_01270 [Oligoflexales bacterium]|nr:hypothetical protein [Oligoflexales bacterium]
MTDSDQSLNHEICRQHVYEDLFSPQKEDRAQLSVGLEIEMLPLILSGADTPRPMPLYSSADEPRSRLTLDQQLRDLAAKKAWTCLDDHKGFLLSLYLEGKAETLTFEPGGQLEFSSKPYQSLTLCAQRVLEVQKDLNEQLSTGSILLQTGINPWHSPEEIGLQVKKSRYKAMDQYFSQISPFGRRMMRQTCSIQMSLDWGSSDGVMAQRYGAAQFLAPWGTALFANSPFLDGSHPNNVLSHRALSWRRLDGSRTGFLWGLAGLKPKGIEEKFASKAYWAESYLQFALNAGVVFIERASFQEGYTVPNRLLRFKDWMEHGYLGIQPTSQDFLTHLSLLFPEVRPKGHFMELRSVDAQQSFLQFTPAAFYLGLLYDQKNLDLISELLPSQLDVMSNRLEKAVFGLQDPVIHGQASRLLQMSLEGLERLPAGYVSADIRSSLEYFFESHTGQQKTPADRLLSMVQGRSGAFPSLMDFENLQNEANYGRKP